MLDVVEHSEKQHDIEHAKIPIREAADVANVVLNLRAQQFFRFQQPGAARGVQRQNLRPAAFHLEAEPTIPGPDIEDTFAGQVLGNRELRDALFQLGDRLVAFNHLTIRQFDGVVPAELVQALDLAAIFLNEVRVAGLAHASCRIGKSSEPVTMFSGSSGSPSRSMYRVSSRRPCCRLPIAVRIFSRM